MNLLVVAATFCVVSACDLDRTPCISSPEECSYPVKPASPSVSQSNIHFWPYPVCLPKGRCAKKPGLRAETGQLHTEQHLVLHISDTSQFHYKRLHARSSMRVGKNMLPRCITNKMFNRRADKLEFAYGTCTLDTVPLEEDDGNLCDLFLPGRITVTDNAGVTNALRCNDGLLYFSEESVCSTSRECTISIDFDVKYIERGPVLYRPFRNTVITLDVELYRPAEFETDTVKVENEKCRQYFGFDRCVGFFTIDIKTDK